MCDVQKWKTNRNKRGGRNCYFHTLLSDIITAAKKITAEKLCSLLKSVLKTVTSFGYLVISIITDGNRINKKMF